MTKPYVLYNRDAKNYLCVIADLRTNEHNIIEAHNIGIYSGIEPRDTFHPIDSLVAALANKNTLHTIRSEGPVELCFLTDAASGYPAPFLESLAHQIRAEKVTCWERRPAATKADD